MGKALATGDVQQLEQGGIWPELDRERHKERQGPERRYRAEAPMPEMRHDQGEDGDRQQDPDKRDNSDQAKLAAAEIGRGVGIRLLLIASVIAAMFLCRSLLAAFRSMVLRAGVTAEAGPAAMRTKTASKAVQSRDRQCRGSADASSHGSSGNGAPPPQARVAQYDESKNTGQASLPIS